MRRPGPPGRPPRVERIASSGRSSGRPTESTVGANLVRRASQASQPRTSGIPPLAAAFVRRVVRTSGATGATRKSHPVGLKTPGKPRLSGRRVRRVVRTANPDPRPVASEISRGAPPYQYFAKEGPRCVERKVNLRFRPHFSIRRLHRRVTDIYRASLLRNRTLTCTDQHAAAESKQPVWNSGRAVGHMLCELGRTLHVVMDSVKGDKMSLE